MKMASVHTLTNAMVIILPLRRTRFAEIFKSSFNHSCMLVNVAYLIKNKRTVFDSEHFLINQPAFSISSTSVFYSMREYLLANLGSIITNHENIV